MRSVSDQTVHWEGRAEHLTRGLRGWPSWPMAESVVCSRLARLRGDPAMVWERLAGERAGIKGGR